MASSNFTISGTENLMKMFKDMPEKGYKQPVMRSFRKAAVPVKKAIVAGLPVELIGLAKAIAIKAYKGQDPVLGVGAFGGGKKYQNSRGITWNPWSLLYWFNYGTLANRYSGHNFKRPRGKKSATWKGGIEPGLFIERSIEASMTTAQTTFEQEFDKEMTKYFQERAAK